jgi:hypothetical protein
VQKNDSIVFSNVKENNWFSGKVHVSGKDNDFLTYACKCAS